MLGSWDVLKHHGNQKYLQHKDQAVITDLIEDCAKP
jgi:hypothetical protein